MIELNRNRPSVQAQTDLQRLQERASHRSNRLRKVGHPPSPSAGERYSVRSLVQRLPTRFFLHTVVALVVPLALLLSQLPSTPIFTTPETTVIEDSGLIGIGPIPLVNNVDLTQVGDPPLSDDALPVPLSLSSRSELLAPLTVSATIAGDVVKLRNGPGLAYDDVSRISGGTNVEVLARHGEWLQVRQSDDPAIYWVAAELVDLPDTVIFNLEVVPDAAIPPPPPPKIGVVREEGLNLRDGPGTNYVSMARMGTGQELTLIEQFDSWFLVEYGTQYGWVTADFLNIVPGVIERVPVAQAIPDPNPPLVGAVLENSVNVRKGPGSAYARVTSVNAGIAVDLLARHKDWYRVALADGTKAWIFSDLLKVAPMAARRVPVTNDIPALPVRAATTRSSGGGGAPVSIAASGDVASFAVQFAGYRYRWGGSSPSSGFDCSGLVSYVYRQYGVGLPHSAAAQFSTRYGAMIGGMGNLAPGDLMFFANTGGRRGISHVAIYIGGGRMIHAMTPAYGVQVSSIWSSYWQNHWVGGIRPYR
ncbi:MAG: C40 family peptidase [Oscillochloris sp.]|nr:C40 family peptidase [Oscillochloris sp.]